MNMSVNRLSKTYSDDGNIVGTAIYLTFCNVSDWLVGEMIIAKIS